MACRILRTDTSLQSALRARAAHWKLSGKDAAILTAGLTHVAGRMNSACKKALKDPSAENLHEWRKWTKYHWYHARLMQAARSRPIRARRKEAQSLAEALGDHHDLAVYRDRLHGSRSRIATHSTSARPGGRRSWKAAPSISAATSSSTARQTWPNAGSPGGRSAAKARPGIVCPNGVRLWRTLHISEKRLRHFSSGRLRREYLGQDET